MGRWYHSPAPVLGDHAAVLDVVVQKLFHLLLRDEAKPVATRIHHNNA
jgi:hypothetical protein